MSRPDRKTPAIIRYKWYVRKTSGCWFYEGSRNTAGYGRIGEKGENLYVHRLSYEEAYGPIPEGLTIDHLCKQKNCVNPEHLEAVTAAENRMRESVRSQTCKRGHPKTEANSYWRHQKGRRLPTRYCRICCRMACERARRKRGAPIRRRTVCT